MKLYSRNQVVIIAVSAVLLVFFLVLGFGLLKFPEDEEVVETSVPEVPQFEIQHGVIPESNLIQVSDYDRYSEDEINTIKVYEQLNEGVVYISTETVGINFFLEPVPMEGGTGSGSIIDRRGYVLTNYHVVEKAYKVFVTLYDGNRI